MNLSRALLIPLCCLGVAGCSSLTNRGTNAPAPNSGPDSFAAAPPPSVAPSTITVRPANLYNMGNTTRRGASKPVSKSTPSKTATTPRTENALARSEPASEPLAKAPPAESTEADDAALMARPVRKGTAKAAPASVDEKPVSTPQSSAPSKLRGPKTAEVLPVSAPPAEEKLDSRLSS